MLRRGGGWPDEDQRLVLDAILLEALGPARDAWRRWEARHDSLCGLPDATRRLLPQLGRRLGELGGTGTLAEEVRARVPYTWKRNQMLLRGVRPALVGLAERRIPAVLLKGAAVAAMAEHGHAVRPMYDVDVLVRPEDVRAAVDVLRAAGFSDVSPLGVGASRRFMAGAGFRAADGSEIDLHWRPLPQPCAGDEVFAGASQREVAGLTVLVPAAEDVFVHACVHGLSAGSSGPRWIPDALLAAHAAGPAFDWERAWSIAARAGAGLSLRDAVTLLRRDYALDAPEELFAEVRAGAAERAVHAVSTRPGIAGPLAHHAEQWAFYRRSALEGGRGPRGLWGFLGHEAARVGASGRPALLRRWCRRGAQRLRGRMRSRISGSVRG